MIAEAVGDWTAHAAACPGCAPARGIGFNEWRPKSDFCHAGWQLRNRALSALWASRA